MRLRYIEIFHAVMQAGTVKGAAQLLHITQPAATRLLQQAEQHAGVLLFRRARGRLVPTSEGRQLYPEVEQLYVRLESVRRLVASLGTASTHPVRVLSVPGLALDWLPQALASWSTRHPRMSASLRTLHSRQIAESLVLREGDVGFVFEAPTHPALHTETIATGRVVCVGEGIGDKPVPLAQLASRDIVDLDPSDPLGRLVYSALRAQSIEPKARMLAHSYHAAIELAAAGFGWALVDSFTAAYASRHPALSVAPLAPTIEVAVYAIRSRDAPSIAAAERLIESMREALNAPLKR